MPKYDFRCADCGAIYEIERDRADLTLPAPCPACGLAGERLYTMPRIFLKADPDDNRPVWHHHDGYGHAHAPRRGRHRLPTEDH